MSDPIKAALDAAVLAYDAARVASHGGNMGRHGMSARNRETIAPMIAAGITAFLRAFPEGQNLRRWDKDTGTMRYIGTDDLAVLADMVERAGGSSDD